MWTGPAIASFTLALIALLASLTALTWQFYTWRRSGPRLTVTARHGIPMNAPNVDLLCVEASNSGRASTIAREFALELPNKHKIVYLQSEVSLAMPAEIPPGGEVSYYFLHDNIIRSLRENGLPVNTPLRPFVKTGHGTTYGKRIRLASDSSSAASDSRS